MVESNLKDVSNIIADSYLPEIIPVNDDFDNLNDNTGTSMHNNTKITTKRRLISSNHFP